MFKQPQFVFAGTIFGIFIGVVLFKISSDTIAHLSSLATIIASLATIFTAFVAYQALSTWKNQFNHSKKFHAIMELEKAAREVLDLTQIYNQIARDQDLSKPRFDSHQKRFDSNNEQTLDRLFIYLNKSIFAESLLSEGEKNDFTYSYIKFDEEIKSIRHKIFDRHNNPYDSADSDINNLRTDVMKNLQSFRKI